MRGAASAWWLLRERRVHGARRIFHISADGVLTVFIFEHPFQHQKFFAQVMAVAAEARTRRVVHDAGGFGDFSAVAFKHFSAHSGHGRGYPGQVSGVECDPDCGVCVYFHGLLSVAVPVPVAPSNSAVLGAAVYTPRPRKTPWF